MSTRNRRVYLCGPINGCSDSEAMSWREWFKSRCLFEFVDPMSRDYRGSELLLYREIVDLDKMDIKKCDAVVVMFEKPSVGTSMEILYAWSNSIPVIVIDVSGKPLSPWLVYHSTSIVESKEGAVSKLIEWFS
jgi:nucleoside 2-deoxyribosyltransferase